jgi:hypothetical protein
MILLPLIFFSVLGLLWLRYFPRGATLVVVVLGALLGSIGGYVLGFAGLELQEEWKAAGPTLLVFLMATGAIVGALTGATHVIVESIDRSRRHLLEQRNRSSPPHPSPFTGRLGS